MAKRTATWQITLASCLLVAFGLSGCVASHAPKSSSSVSKPLTSPKVVHCFDSVGHQKGAKPYLLGGSCFCTPTPKRFAEYQKLGYFEHDSYESFVERYRAKGWQTGLDHQACNNLCQWGPHVLKGGGCMVSPTPATRNYEEVLTGRFAPLPIKQQKRRKK